MMSDTLFGRLKNAIKRGVFSKPIRGLGFTAIPTRVLEHYPAAAHTEKLLGLLDIDCVLDVGANIGQYRDFLRDQVRYTGRIVSFEPIPSHAEYLNRRAASDPKWTVCGIALGRSPGSAHLNIMKDTQFSSFREPDHSRLQMFSHLNVVEQRAEVQVDTLDRVLADIEKRLGPFRGIYLKLDTQGFDMEVINGARQVLHRIKALQTEASVKAIYAGMPDYQQTINELGAMNFELSGIYPNNPGHFPRLVEFDCHMINSAELKKLQNQPSPSLGAELPSNPTRLVCGE